METTSHKPQSYNEQRRDELFLIRAAIENNIHELKKMIEQGADVNAVDANGSTALHHAAGRGHTEIAKILMNNNANKNIKNKNGYTAWSFALAAHPKHNAVPMIAIVYGEIDTAIIKDLLEESN